MTATTNATLAVFFCRLLVAGRISCGPLGPRGADTSSWPLGAAFGADRGHSPSQTGSVDC